MDSLERKEEQEGESDKFSDKTGKEKASSGEMRNKAMERLGETKKGQEMINRGRKENIPPTKRWTI